MSTQQADDLLGTFRSMAGATTVGLTVMGAIVHQSAGVAAGTGTFSTSWRVGLVVDTLSSTAAELPSPVSDQFEDWMWNSRYFLGNNTLGWLGGQGEETWHPRVRSRRKIDELDQTLWLVAQPVLGGATTLSYSATVRVLLALP